MVEIPIWSELHILLVEDSVLNQEIIRDVLENLGYRVGVVASGTAAVEALTRDPYDLVLMDCHMPEMDGYEAARRIRARENAASSCTRTPILALTADSDEGTREKCLAAGMDGYVSKPCNREVLHGVLRAHLPIRSRMIAGSEAGPQPGPPPTGSGDAPAIDARALNDLRALQAQGAIGLVARAIDLYVQDAARHIQGIREAVSKHDAGALRKEAHSLKSASAYLGATGVAELSRALERMGATKTVEGAEVTAAALVAAFDRARLALAEERGKEAG